MPILQGNRVEMRIFTKVTNQTSINVRHYRCDSSLGLGADLAVAAQQISDSVAADLKAVLSVEATYRGLGLRIVRPLPAGLETLTSSSSGPGTGTGIVMPLQICGLISLRSMFSGRSGRGRFYVPFPPNSQGIAGGLPSAGYLTGLQPLAVLLGNTITVGTVPNTSVLVPAIWQRKTDTMVDIVGFITPQKWATQRRRGSFGRPNDSPI